MLLARCLRDERDPDRVFARLVELCRARVVEIVVVFCRNSSRKAFMSSLALWMWDLALLFFF